MLGCYKELNSNRKAGKKRKKLQELLYAFGGNNLLRGRGIFFDLKAHLWGRGQGVTVAAAKLVQSALRRTKTHPHHHHPLLRVRWSHLFANNPIASWKEWAPSSP